MNQENDKAPPSSPRIALIRDATVLQVKLLADGLRDAALIPFSLIGAGIGLIRGGEDADREFRQIIKLGRRTERWINLFGHHRPLARKHPAGSLDSLIERVENVVRDQYRKGSTTSEAKAAIEKALQEDPPER